MILEAILLAQLTGVMKECTNETATSGIKFYSTNCENIYDGAATNSVATTSGAPGPTCPDGYTLMADLTMHPKCAKEIIEPLYK